MDHVFFQAYEAFNGCRICVDKFSTYNAEWSHGRHPLYDPNFIEGALRGEEGRFRAAREPLRSALSAIDGKISSLWPSLSDEFRSNAVSRALKVDDPFRQVHVLPFSGILAYLERPRSPELPDRLSDKALDRQLSRVVRERGQLPIFENEKELFEAFRSRRARLEAWKGGMETFLPKAQEWLSLAEHELREPAVKIDTVMFGGEKNVVQVTFGDGTTINAPFAIGHTIQNSLNANKVGSAPDDVKIAYESLVKAIADHASAMSETQCEDLATDTETLGRELAREQPRQNRVREMMDGIAASAAAIGKAAGPILDAIGKLRAVIGI